MTLDSVLDALPFPQVIEEVDYAARLTQSKDGLLLKMTEAGIDFDVSGLQTDPAIVVTQSATFAELLVRQRINEAIQAYILPLSSSADLDNLAAFYDVTRLLGEGDASLRKRVVLAIQGRSPGGTEARYKFVALSADVRVADVAVYTVGRDPTIQVAVFASDNAGVADVALLAAVDNAMQAPDVRMVNDRIVVASAAQFAVTIEATVWLKPHASESVLEEIDLSLRQAWAAEMVLGRDVAKSWLFASMQLPWVHKLEIASPVADIEVPFNQAAALGVVNLTVAGRGF